MHPVARASTVNRLAKWLLKPIARLLRTGDPAATMDRLFSSKHVTDLQLITAVAFTVVLLIFVVGLPLSIGNQVQSQLPNIASRKSNWIFLYLAFQLPFASAGSFLTFFAPVFVVFGAILAWAYQVGSARLGVVDLFACEISTLCRVAVVVETVSRFVDRFEKGPPAQVGSAGAHMPAQPFTSQENYFPVFEGNTHDLQTLEARVVVNITAFYTYMKAVRDSRRTLAEIIPEPADLVSPPSRAAHVIGIWHEAARDIVYMLFLGLESARRSIADLVEFEPERAERTIVILISELEAYRFLCDQFRDEDDIRHKRLMLRQPEYQRMVPPLIESVTASRASEKIPEGAMSQWEEAFRLLHELRKLYHAAMDSDQGANHG